MSTSDSTTLRAFGHDFRQMDHRDFEGFAGAESGSYIAYFEDVTLILSPDKSEVTVIDNGSGLETAYVSTVIRGA